ncbi:unnamed protein product [Adineta steineri]|uniref:PDZ domain-containing protein n=1 Tax=Adineta steineri TaxID=433720 RepID=A0A819LQJ0_9BILA|nr:unnamed protein product [Adineta steineri]CAF3968251.1 unnamed protein product [Adineta steineri]
MSATVFTDRNSTATQTRRTPTRNEDIGTNSQRNTNHRSLSGKFRNLFRKNSASPNRTISNDNFLPPRTPLTPPPPLPRSRQRSPSPEPLRASTEAPHLRAPIVEWPFGKKKPKAPSDTISSTKKPKNSRKSKKNAIPMVEISNPVYVPENQTSIRGHNFVQRTPELVHGGTGRTLSSSSYETPTKGFRDFTIIDTSRSSQQVDLPNVDVVTQPYISDYRHSPSPNHQRLPYTNFEYSNHHHDTSIPTRTISDINIIPTPPQHRKIDSALHSLAENTPILPQTSSTLPSSLTFTTNPNQWKGTSSSSLNNSEIRSTIPPPIDVDIPKLHTPLVPLGVNTTKREPKQTNLPFHYNDPYNSTSTINKLNQPYIGTYTSVPDTESIHNGNSISSKPTQYNSKLLLEFILIQKTFSFFLSASTYPGLSAIVEHHIHPNYNYYREHPSIITKNPSQSTNRFETSTETYNDYNQWSPNTTKYPRSPSPSDGYIRPLTPPKPSVHPDVSVIYVDLDDLRSPSRTSHHTSSEIPVTYRSSATIYTKNKNNFTNGGELRTWSVRDSDDDNNKTRKTSSTSIFIEPTNNDHQIVPIKTSTELPYTSKIYEQEINKQNDKKDEKYQYTYGYNQTQQYSYDTRYYSSSSRYSDNINSTLTRPLTTTERDSIYDQSIHSYKDTGYIQEPLNTTIPAENPDLSLRHYTLQRTDSYHGLGIVISTDAETRLNHRIRDVEPSSPGSRIGLRKNDRIVNVNGINVENVEFGDVLILIKQGLTKNHLEFTVINEAVLI